MNKKSTLALTLASLLGAGLLLPAAASAHGNPSDRGAERGHSKHRVEHRHQSQPQEWYLLRHHEQRPYGYRPQTRIYHTDSYYRDVPHRHYTCERYERDSHSPVELVIRYEVTL